jgi:glutamate-1-semialdehyde 2,1-aminomutase
MERANPRRTGDDYVYMSGTLNGNPIATRAGVATLGVLRQPGTYERLEAVSTRLRDGLREIASGLPRPLHILGDGAVFGLAFTDGDPSDPLVVATSDRKILGRIEAGLIRNSVLANAPSKLYVSTAHSEDDIDRTLEIFEEVVRESL